MLVCIVIYTIFISYFGSKFQKFLKNTCPDIHLNQIALSGKGLKAP